MIDKLKTRWQIGMGDARHNAETIYTEGADSLTGDAICSVAGIYSHKTLGDIEKYVAEGDDRCVEGLRIARAIAAVPEMFEFVELCAIGGNSHAQKIVDLVETGKCGC